MNRQETAHLLGVIALTDRRELSDELTQLWHAILGSIRIEDALAAVLKHRSESTEWLQAAHIVRIVRAERAKRIAAANIVYEPINDETGREFLDRIGALTRAAGDGRLQPRSVGLALEPGPGVPQVPSELDAVIAARRAARAALSVACPYCRATAGNPCTIGKRHGRNGFIHPARIEARQRTAA